MVALQRQLGSEEEEAVCRPLQSSSLQGEQVLHCRALLNGDTGDAEHNQAREPDGTTHLTRRNHRIRAPPPPAAGPRKAQRRSQEVQDRLNSRLVSHRTKAIGLINDELPLSMGGVSQSQQQATLSQQ